MLRHQDRRTGVKRGLAAAVTGGFLLAEVLLVAAIFETDGAGVRLLGHELGAECAFHRRTQLPCPTCGMTRSVVLAAQGEVARAAELNPAGPIAVGGMLAAAAGLLTLAGVQRLGRPEQARAVAAALAGLTIACAGVGGVVWIGWWLRAVS